MFRRLHHKIAYALNFLLAALLLFTAYGGMVSPDISALPAIAAMTFPAVLCLTVAALLINLIWCRPAALIDFIAIAVCSGPLLSYCPLNIFTAKSSAKSSSALFTLMNYNVMNLTDYRAQTAGSEDIFTGASLRYILSKQTDIVALQECAISNWETSEKDFPTLTDSLKAFYPYIDATTHGLTLLSRYPATPLEFQFPEMNSFAVQGYEINIEGHTTYLFNVHLQSIGLSPEDKKLYMELTKGDARTKAELREVRTDLLSKLAEAYRQRAIQADILRDTISSLNGNIIVCGDFNDIPDSYAVRTLCADDMQSAFNVAGCGPGISYHADRFYFRIDHCLYRGDMRPLSCKIGHVNTSDHYPMITTFEWLSPPKSVHPSTPHDL